MLCIPKHFIAKDLSRINESFRKVKGKASQKRLSWYGKGLGTRNKKGRGLYNGLESVIHDTNLFALFFVSL